MLKNIKRNLFFPKALDTVWTKGLDAVWISKLNNNLSNSIYLGSFISLYKGNKYDLGVRFDDDKLIYICVSSDNEALAGFVNDVNVNTVFLSKDELSVIEEVKSRIENLGLENLNELKTNKVFYPSADDWMWDYCHFLGSWVNPYNGAKYDLGIFTKKDLKDTSGAMVYGNIDGNYISGELRMFGKSGIAEYDAVYEETRRRAINLGLFID